MDIKGVGNYKNNLKIKLPEDNTASQNREKVSAASKPEEVKSGNKGINLRVETLMGEMKDIQNTVSQRQSYLDFLHIARNKLASLKDMKQIYNDLKELREKAMFNKKPLMDNIIPAKQEFYNNTANMQEMKNKVAKEIEKTKKEIQSSQQEISKFSISLENIRASLNSKDVAQMQSLFDKSMLYKSFNKDLVVSLML